MLSARAVRLLVGGSSGGLKSMTWAVFIKY
jgi:homoserine acetyltransferase